MMSPHYNAHAMAAAMTARLLCHLQNFVVISSTQFGLMQSYYQLIFTRQFLSAFSKLAPVVRHEDFTGDPLHSRAACTQPCNVNTHSRAHCSPGARLCEQWEHGCVNNGARLCASARLCRGSPVDLWVVVQTDSLLGPVTIAVGIDMCSLALNHICISMMFVKSIN